jgi:hypothetical protein
MSSPVDNPPLDAENAAFIRCGVMVSVASRDASHVASLSRALGCRVAPDRRRMTAFLPASQCETLLRDLRETGTIAVVFTQPSTHRTIQLKGTDATLGPLEPGGTALIDANIDALVKDVAPLGYSEIFVRTLLAYEAEDLVEVTFTPTSAFAQTPGPLAGKRL